MRLFGSCRFWRCWRRRRELRFDGAKFVPVAFGKNAVANRLAVRAIPSIENRVIASEGCLQFDKSFSAVHHRTQNGKISKKFAVYVN